MCNLMRIVRLVGREAVDWLVDNKYAKSRSEAVEIGQRLYKLGYIQHVTKGARNRRLARVLSVQRQVLTPLGRPQFQG